MPQFTAAGSVLVALAGILWQQGFVSDSAAVKVVELVSASAHLFEDAKPAPAAVSKTKCAPSIVVDVSALEKRLERRVPFFVLPDQLDHGFCSGPSSP